MTVLDARLRAARRRMIAADLIEKAATCLLAGALIYVAAAAVLVALGKSPWAPPLLVFCIAGALCFALLWSWWSRPDLQRAAILLDARGQTRDRFTTGLSLETAGSGRSLEPLAMAECERFSATFDVKQRTPLRIPRRLAALVVPAVALSMLFWHHSLSVRPDSGTELAREALLEKADELEALEQQLQTEAQTPELRKLAEEMREAIERLRTAAEARDADPRQALRELSALEGMIAAMEKALDAARRDMEKVADNLERDRPDAANDAEAVVVNTALSEEQRSELERALAEAREAQAAGEPSARSEALRRLAEQLRQMAQQSRQGQGRQSRQLQSMKMALQNIKFGRSDGSAQRRNPEGQEGDQPLVLDLSGQGQGDAGEIALNLPSGEPGSERDRGTTETPMGDAMDRQDPQGGTTQLDAVLGEGESLMDLVPTAGDTSKSTQRYRELYNAIAGASEDSVEREEIPLASRFFIKRYFEAIRPTE